MSEVIEGYVEKIKFRNVENGYTVLELSNDDEDITCVGNFTFINEGEFVKITGTLVDHKVYGKQISVEHYEVKEPEDSISMERYLGSGAIKGIGPKLAIKIVSLFQEDTFRVMEEEPELLAQVKGVSEKIAQKIGEQFIEKREMRNAMIFLLQYGISNNLAVKIYNTYGSNLYDIIKENPYRLAEDVHGVGFKIADEIGSKVGIQVNSGFRIKSGIYYVLSQAAGRGHVYLPEHLLYQNCSEILGTHPDELERYLTESLIDKRVVMKKEKGENIYYQSSYYYMELNSARMLMDLNITFSISPDEIEHRMSHLEKQTGIELDELQRMAVKEVARNGLLIVTGGPGTGKTTTINAIIHFLEEEGLDILLAAPTGRAAKRMSETTGYEAQTIHRLLELSGGLESEDKGMHFERNEICPLEADAIIIDEMSMVDINLMHALLKAITMGTRLILVGDINQLPPVGPGNVLRDIMDSECCNVVKLTKIFRQAAESDIIINAHKINAGEMIPLDNKSKDFFLLQRSEANIIIQVMIQLISQKLPKYVNAEPFDIQVLTPMRKGELGVERLNKVLQQYLNTPSPDKNQIEFHQVFIREGDKVMQVKNNYQVKWEKRGVSGVAFEEGTGIFNGDAGIVREVNNFSNEVTVEFDECKHVIYNLSSLEELELAYAITIHKSQGSEYPAVVMPILSGPRMLFNRNLLYTAVTRAKKCVTIVGSQKMVSDMIHNEIEQKRYSTLKVRMIEMNQERIG